MITLQFLAEWALRSSILIASGVLLLRVLRVKDPSLRSAATTALLCGSLAIPLLGVALPKVPLPVMTSHPARVERPEVVYPSAATSAPASAVFETNAPVAERGAAPSHHFDWARVAVVLYFIVAGAILLRLGFGLVMSLRLLHRSPSTGESTEGIEIRENPGVRAPIVLGFLRPAIVLPGDWRAWDDAKLKAVLAHERTHIRRHDPAVQLLSALHRALLWYSPMSWILHLQIVQVAEEVCDDSAVAATRDRILCAEVLLEFVRRGGSRVDWQGVPMALYGRTDKRIHRILDGTALSHGVSRWSLAAILILASPLAYLAAAVHPKSMPEHLPTLAPIHSWARSLPAADTASKPAETTSPKTSTEAVASLVAMGDFHLRRGETEEAITYYQAGLKLDPGSGKLRKKLENAMKACRNEDALLHAGLKCGAATPGAAPSPSSNPAVLARINMGDFHMQRGEWDDAIASYREGLRLDPASAELRRKLDNAMKICRQEDSVLHVGLNCGGEVPAVTPEPSSSPKPDMREVRERITLGDFHIHSGEWDDAIAAYREGLSLDPSSTELRQKLDMAIRGCKKENTTLNEGLSCGAGLPGVPPLPGTGPDARRQAALGDFHLGRGEFEDAINAYREGLQLDPASTELRGKLENAVRACQKENATLNEGLDCGGLGSSAALVPAGPFSPWDKPVTKGQMVPNNSIEGGLKPIGSLSVPPIPSAPPKAFVAFMIGIDPNGNVTPGRVLSDFNGLGPRVTEAAEGWKFQPPTVNGVPVSTNIQAIVVF